MQVRIYYEDTDAGGVVYHANYLAYFERGRTEFLRERGLSVRELQDAGFIFPVIRADVTYRSPGRHDDLLRIETEPAEIGKTSFTFLQRAVREVDGKLLAEGRITVVCTGPEMKAKRLPDEILAALAKTA
jgi:acyl-CoA thioester hydrolase